MSSFSRVGALRLKFRLGEKSVFSHGLSCLSPDARSLIEAVIKASLREVSRSGESQRIPSQVCTLRVIVAVVVAIFVLLVVCFLQI